MPQGRYQGIGARSRYLWLFGDGVDGIEKWDKRFQVYPSMLD